MFRGLRERIDGRLTPRPAQPEQARSRKGPHNLFEAAAVYVAAVAEDDEPRSAEAAAWVSQEALSFGVTELSCRAVIALAREWDTSPQQAARTLLGLPPA
jgi:hypothetical protein